MSESLTAALELAAQGIYVFPALATFNEKANKLDKKPAINDWQAQATTDANQIRNWWSTFPDAIPGIELGRSNLFVVDLDRHPGGPDGVVAFKSFRGDNPAPQAPTVKTASGGYHIYLKQPEGEKLGTHRQSAERD
jgi:Bifunctional DNA primase/polymerase, N-terminal